MNKQLVRSIHLWVSLPLGVIIFLLCISGALLVFKNEMRDMLGMPRVIGVHQKAEAHHSSQKTFDTSDTNLSHKTEKLKSKSKHTEKRNQTTEKDFFSHLQQFHKSLLMGQTGKYIVTYSTIAFIVILVTGIWAVWPQNKRQWKQRLRIATDKTAYRKWYDSHVSLGFWLVIWLLVLALSGVAIGLRLFSDDEDKWLLCIMLDLHTGRWGGMPTKIITFVVSLAGASLPITGYYLYFKRIYRHKKVQ